MYNPTTRTIFEIHQLWKDISECKELVTDEDIEEVIKFTYLKYLQSPRLKQKYMLTDITYLGFSIYDTNFWQDIPIYKHEERVSEYVLEHFGDIVRNQVHYFLNQIKDHNITIDNIEVIESLLIIDTR